MQVLIFDNASQDDRAKVGQILQGLGSTPQQLAAFQRRMAAERAAIEAGRGQSKEQHLSAALGAIDAAFAGALKR